MAQVNGTSKKPRKPYYKVYSDTSTPELSPSETESDSSEEEVGYHSIEYEKFANATSQMKKLVNSLLPSPKEAKMEVDAETEKVNSVTSEEQQAKAKRKVYFEFANTTSQITKLVNNLPSPEQAKIEVNTETKKVNSMTSKEQPAKTKPKVQKEVEKAPDIVNSDVKITKKPILTPNIENVDTAEKAKKKCDPNNLFCENIKNGNFAFTSNDFELAKKCYGSALDLVEKNSENKNFQQLGEKKMVVLKYCYATSCYNCGSIEDLTTAVSIFNEIISVHSSVDFPAAIYSLSISYQKLKRFNDALPHLNHLQSLIEEKKSWSTYKFLQTDDIIEECQTLQVLVQDLVISFPKPDAVCRFKDCKFHSSIYFDDPSFKGYVTILCKEQCKLQYHVIPCWKAVKDTMDKSDKEFIDSVCLTPDCTGHIISLESFGKNCEIEKCFTAEDAKWKMKYKKTKFEKKCEIREQKKKKRHRSASVCENQEIVAHEEICDENLPPIIDTSPVTEQKPMSVQSQNKPKNDTKNSGTEPTVHDITAASVPLYVLKKDSNECTDVKPTKKDRKKPKKAIVGIDEFCKDAKLNEALPVNDYQLRLFRLQQNKKHNENEKTTLPLTPSAPVQLDNAPVQALNEVESLGEMDSERIKLETFLQIEKLVDKHGFVNVNSDDLVNTLELLSPEAKKLIARYGGFIKFIQQNQKLALVKGNLCRFADMIDYYNCESVGQLEDIKLQESDQNRRLVETCSPEHVAHHHYKNPASPIAYLDPKSTNCSYSNSQSDSNSTGFNSDFKYKAQKPYKMFLQPANPEENYYDCIDNQTVLTKEQEISASMESCESFTTQESFEATSDANIWKYNQLRNEQYNGVQRTNTIQTTPAFQIDKSVQTENEETVTPQFLNLQREVKQWRQRHDVVVESQRDLIKERQRLAAKYSFSKSQVEHLEKQLELAEVQVKGEREAHSKCQSLLAEYENRVTLEKDKTFTAELKLLQLMKQECLQRVDFSIKINSQKLGEIMSMFPGIVKCMHPVVSANLDNYKKMLKSHICELRNAQKTIEEKYNKQILDLKAGRHFDELEKVEIPEIKEIPTVEEVLNKQISLRMSTQSVPNATNPPSSTVPEPDSLQNVPLKHSSTSSWQPDTTASPVFVNTPVSMASKTPPIDVKMATTFPMAYPPVASKTPPMDVKMATAFPMAYPPVASKTPPIDVKMATAFPMAYPPVANKAPVTISTIKRFTEPVAVETATVERVNPPSAFLMAYPPVGVTAPIAPTPIQTVTQQVPSKTCAAPPPGLTNNWQNFNLPNSRKVGSIFDVLPPKQSVSYSTTDNPMFKPPLVHRSSFSFDTKPEDDSDSVQSFCSLPPHSPNDIGVLNASNATVPAIQMPKDSSSKSGTSLASSDSNGQKKKSGFDKILEALVERYPEKTESDLLAHICQYRQREKLSGRTVGSIISGIVQVIEQSSAKDPVPMKKNVPLPKTLVNRLLVSDSPQIPPPTKPEVCPWGTEKTARAPQEWTGPNVPEKNCVICFEDMTLQTGYKVPCGHYFHRKCVHKWMETMKTCPVCRTYLVLPEEYPALY